MNRILMFAAFLLVQNSTFASIRIVECSSYLTTVKVKMEEGVGEYTYKGEEGEKAGAVESADYLESTFHIDLFETLPNGIQRNWATLQTKTAQSEATFVDAECNHIEFLKCRIE